MKRSLLYCVLCMIILTACTHSTTQQKQDQKSTEEEVTQLRVSMAFTGDLLFEQGLYDA